MCTPLSSKMAHTGSAAQPTCSKQSILPCTLVIERKIKKNPLSFSKAIPATTKDDADDRRCCRHSVGVGYGASLRSHDLFWRYLPGNASAAQPKTIAPIRTIKPIKAQRCFAQRHHAENV